MTRINSAVVLLILASLAHTGMAASPALTQAIADYDRHRWMTAMNEFIGVLESDPQNSQAHAYLRLIAGEMERQQKAEAESARVMLLTEAAKLMDENRMDSRPIQKELAESEKNAASRQEARRRELCQTAQIQITLGNLPAANDLVLQVLQEDPRDAEAQRALSDLQSALHEVLNGKTQLSPVERATYEGFFAYGQADYATAVASWGRARDALDPKLAPEEMASQVALLHFEPYEKIAQAHVNQEHEAARRRTLFETGVAAYEKQHFDQALASFRQIALADSTYPQLGQYLVQSEAAVERKRTSDLSEAKRQEAAQDFARGMASLEKGRDAEAKSAFEAVLLLDPAHPQAKLYLAQMEAQKARPAADPVAGQQHYETGVVAYVSGDLEQAIREWHVALRFDPDNPKVMTALNKVQRELASSKDLP